MNGKLILFTGILYWWTDIWFHYTQTLTADSFSSVNMAMVCAPLWKMFYFLREIVEAWHRCFQGKYT